MGGLADGVAQCIEVEDIALFPLIEQTIRSPRERKAIPGYRHLLPFDGDSVVDLRQVRDNIERVGQLHPDGIGAGRGAQEPNLLTARVDENPLSGGKENLLFLAGLEIGVQTHIEQFHTLGRGYG